jgi:hypothetical protein
VGYRDIPEVVREFGIAVSRVTENSDWRSFSLPSYIYQFIPPFLSRYPLIPPSSNRYLRRRDGKLIFVQLNNWN